MKSGDWSEISMRKALDNSIATRAHDLVGAGMTDAETRAKITPMFAAMRSWATSSLYRPDIFQGATHHVSSSSSSSPGARADIPALLSISGQQVEVLGDCRRRSVCFRLRRVVGTEVTIWSPLWGLKGQVDAVVEMELKSAEKAKAKGGGWGKKMVGRIRLD